MEATVLVAVLSLAGTLLGTLGGIYTSARLTNFRIAQLEKKVDELSGVTGRTTRMEEQLHSLFKRLEQLEHMVSS